MPAGAALYGTILAAYKTLAASYQPGYGNAVIVLTAGVENAPGDISGARKGNQMLPLHQLADELNRERLTTSKTGAQHAGSGRCAGPPAAPSGVRHAIRHRPAPRRRT